jgi:SAM-dependent methyltransferase
MLGGRDFLFTRVKEGGLTMREKEGGICCGSGLQRNEPEMDKIREELRRHYASLISQEKSGTSCCGPTNKSLEKSGKGKFAEWAGYTEEELLQIPGEAAEYSFGCGNPLAYAELRPGEVVLDLGSGAGIDVFLAAKKVGKAGKVIGLDMTPEMIDKAQKNAIQAGLNNVEFRLGVMEDIPLEDNSVDWVISNCVINLSPDKRQVFKEALRVLKPGGKLLISDIVTNGLTKVIEQSKFEWAGCVGGALEEEEYLRIIQEVGFTQVEIKGRTNAGGFLIQLLSDEKIKESLLPEERDCYQDISKEIDDKIISLKVLAMKPVGV